jgi:hypothetical protein
MDASCNFNLQFYDQQERDKIAQKTGQPITPACDSLGITSPRHIRNFRRETMNQSLKNYGAALIDAISNSARIPQPSNASPTNVAMASETLPMAGDTPVQPTIPTTDCLNWAQALAMACVEVTYARRKCAPWRTTPNQPLYRDNQNDSDIAGRQPDVLPTWAEHRSRSHRRGHVVASAVQPILHPPSSTAHPRRRGKNGRNKPKYCTECKLPIKGTIL